MNVGALGIGPLLAGFLAQWVMQPLTLPYLLFAALGAVALIGVTAAPETGAPAPRAATESRPAGSPRAVGLPVPAAAATIAAFSATGLFAGLSGLFLATTPHRPSRHCPAQHCAWCFRPERRPSWQRPGYERRACSHSA